MAVLSLRPVTRACSVSPVMWWNPQRRPRALQRKLQSPARSPQATASRRSGAQCLSGAAVTRVLVTESDALDLEARASRPTGRCPHCGGEDLQIKERPVVGVRDLPLAGRVARLLWRKRRWRCRGCGRSPTEQHPALPARQRAGASESAWPLAPRRRRPRRDRPRGGDQPLPGGPRPGARGADARRGGSAPRLRDSAAPQCPPHVPGGRLGLSRAEGPARGSPPAPRVPGRPAARGGGGAARACRDPPRPGTPAPEGRRR
jgi:hypothetical protein